MSDTPTGAVGDQTPATASGNQDGQKSADAVAYETHRKLLSEKKALAERLAQLEAAHKEREETEARQKQDWKKLLDVREQELASERDRRSSLEGQVFKAVKKSAFQKALGSNFNPNYEKLIDFDQIVIDPAGNVDGLALNKYVEQFRKDFREIISPVAVPGVPQNAPQGVSTERTKEDIFKDFAKLL
jgi:exonuclease VII large subunit